MAAAEKSCPFKKTIRKTCFIHFDDVFQSLTSVTEARLKKFVACRARWAKLEGEKSDICMKTYELFSDVDVGKHFSGEECCGEIGLYYHQNCYKRLCDENKLQKAESKTTPKSEQEDIEVETDLTPPEKMLRRSLSDCGQNSEVKARSRHVLPPICIICEKKSDLFAMVGTIVLLYKVKIIIANM